MRIALKTPAWAGKKSGYTLIEFMIVSVVMMVFFLSVAAVMIVGYRNWNINTAVITLHDDLVNGLRFMVRELREAGAASPNGIQILGPDDNGIRFELPTAVGSLGPTAWKPVDYTMSGNGDGRLLRTDGSNVRVIATNISDVDFTYNTLLNPREIGIALTGTREASNGTLLTQVLTMEVTVRN